MDSFKVWWKSLQTREQKLVGISVIVMAIGVVYWGLWIPVSNAEQQAQQNLAAQQQTLKLVKQTANKISAISQDGKKVSFNGSLSAAVNQAAGSAGLSVSRMQPQGDKIQVWLDDSPFERLLAFVSELTKNRGLSLDSLDITVSETPGLVRIRRIQFSK